MKRFIFKFCGGPLDGTSVAGELAKHPEVRRYYALTHHGRVGQRFRTASEYAVNVLVDEHLQETAPHKFQQHVYEVVQRIKNGNVVLIQVQYVQPPAT
jgi:hypothetical protein